jgi:3-deoxy-D-manno-octulosonate 8-phosphate phosphatase (KDO 8-P phosphatase)
MFCAMCRAIIHGVFPFCCEKAATNLKDELTMSLNHRKLPKLAKINLLVLDVDGTLTDGQVLYPQKEINFSPYDGHGLKALMKRGIQVAILTGRPDTMAVNMRCDDLDIKLREFGSDNKRLSLIKILQAANADSRRTAYMGDDIPDIDAMLVVGLAAAPANAHPDVKEKADFISSRKGGDGAVRELCDLILEYYA